MAFLFLDGLSINLRYVVFIQEIDDGFRITMHDDEEYTFNKSRKPKCYAYIKNWLASNSD